MKPWYTYNREKSTNKNNILVHLKRLLKDEDTPKDTKKFLKALQEYYKKNNGLTIKQYRALEKITYNQTSEGKKEYQKWVNKYNDEKRNVAKICANYYSKTNYFYELSKKILNNKNFIPTESQYKSMCENKYALKVIKSTFSKPLYLAGSVVQLRKTAKPIKEMQKEEFGVIIETSVAAVISAAKNAKRYTVLPFGKTKTVYVEERFLKKAKNCLTNSN